MLGRCRVVEEVGDVRLDNVQRGHPQLLVLVRNAVDGGAASPEFARDRGSRHRAVARSEVAVLELAPGPRRVAAEPQLSEPGRHTSATASERRRDRLVGAEQGHQPVGLIGQLSVGTERGLAQRGSPVRGGLGTGREFD